QASRSIRQQTNRRPTRTSHCPQNIHRIRSFLHRAIRILLYRNHRCPRFPECSYKGGLPGFVRILDDRTLAFPDYDGNGMFRSLGNILANPRIGLLFINFEDPDRLRINGLATVHRNHPLATFPDAKLIIRVKAQRIFPNCPRYIHEMKLMKYSVYAPHRKYVPPVPEWKKLPEFKDALPHESEY